jgi:cinnamyl-alcohol dehydrogenase
MAIQFARAFGMEVTVFSRSPAKEKEAREVLGAHNFVISTDEKQMKVQDSPCFYKQFLS